MSLELTPRDIFANRVVQFSFKIDDCSKIGTTAGSRRYNLFKPILLLLL